MAPTCGPFATPLFTCDNHLLPTNETVSTQDVIRVQKIGRKPGLSYSAQFGMKLYPNSPFGLLSFALGDRLTGDGINRVSLSRLGGSSIFPLAPLMISPPITQIQRHKEVDGNVSG